MENRVYVSNLPWHVAWQELKALLLAGDSILETATVDAFKLNASYFAGPYEICRRGGVRRHLHRGPLHNPSAICNPAPARTLSHVPVTKHPKRSAWQETGRSRGCGLVAFRRAEDAQRAAQFLH